MARIPSLFDTRPKKYRADTGKFLYEWDQPFAAGTPVSTTLSTTGTTLIKTVGTGKYFLAHQITMNNRGATNTNVGIMVGATIVVGPFLVATNQLVQVPNYLGQNALFRAEPGQLVFATMDTMSLLTVNVFNSEFEP